jgi:hypothetical protein
MNYILTWLKIILIERIIGNNLRQNLQEKENMQMNNIKVKFMKWMLKWRAII